MPADHGDRPVRADDRLRVPERFTVVPAPDGSFRLHSLTFSLELRGGRGDLLGRLLALLDRERPWADVLAAFDPDDRPRVTAEVEALLERGALEVVHDVPGLTAAERRRLAPQIAFFSHFVAPEREGAVDGGTGEVLPRSGEEYQLLLARSTVVVVGLGATGSAVVRALAVAGVGRVVVCDPGTVDAADRASDGLLGGAPVGEPRAAVVRRRVEDLGTGTSVEPADRPTDVDGWARLLGGAACAALAEDSADPRTHELVNEAALVTGTPWSSARSAGFEVHVGPTVLPRETACWTCFELRRRSNAPDLAELDLVDRHARVAGLRPEHLLVSPAAALLALEVVKVVTLFTAPASYAHLLSLSLVSGTTRLHPVLRVPRCPACGRPAQARPTIHVWQRSAGEDARDRDAVAR